MARGKSGRVVLEIDPELKRQLYATLENKQQTMKDWFIKEAESLITGAKQATLFTVSEKTTSYKHKTEEKE
jgi:hypothetical protein